MEAIYKISIAIFQIVLVRYLYNMEKIMKRQQDYINTLNQELKSLMLKKCYKCSNGDENV